MNILKNFDKKQTCAGWTLCGRDSWSETVICLYTPSRVMNCVFKDSLLAPVDDEAAPSMMPDDVFCVVMYEEVPAPFCILLPHKAEEGQ